MASTTNAPYPKTSPLRRLFGLVQPNRADILSVIVFSMLQGGLLLVTPVAVQALVNNVAFGATAPSIAILAGLLAIGLILGALVLLVQTWIVEILQRRIFVRLFADLTERLRIISWEERSAHYNPELVNRFFDVVTIQKSASAILLEGSSALLSIIVGLLFIALYHPFMLVMGIIVSILALIIFLFPMRFGVKTAMKESGAKYAAAAWLEEIARHPVTFRGPGGEAFVRERSLGLAKDYVTYRRKHFGVVFWQFSAALALQVIAGTAVLGLGGWLVVQGQLTLGQLVAAELVMAVVVSGVAKLMRYTEKYYDLIAAVDKVGKLTDLETERLTSRHDHGTHASTASIDAAKAEGPARIKIDGLVLRGRGGVPHSKVDLEIAPGELVAITGPNGVGKSFLLETMYGLHAIDQGRVYYDGQNLANLTVGDLRHEIALATERDLFEGTILENLTLGRKDLRLSDVQDILEKVGLRSSIDLMPKALNTMLSPTGAPLSPGQASQVVVARLLLLKPRLLLIDRLLDDLSEAAHEVTMNALRTATKDSTIIAVTNDQLVAAACQRSIVLQPLPEASQ